MRRTCLIINLIKKLLASERERERERERDYRSIMWYLRASVLETYPTWIWLLI